MSHSLCRTPVEALNSVPAALLIRRVGYDRVKKQIEYELNKAAIMLNIGGSLNPMQASIIAEQLLVDHEWESVDDFSIALNRGIKGAYSDKGKVFGLDISVIYDWVRKYLDEKAQARERKFETEKAKLSVLEPVVYKEISQETEKLIKDYAESLKASARAIPPMSKDDIKSTGQEQPPKPKAKSRGYQIEDPKEELREQKRQWALEVHDLHTGNRLPNYIDFEIWLKEKGK